MFSAFLNFLVFKTDRLSNDDSKFKGADGKGIVLDTSWDPKIHVRTYGEVVSVPPHLSHVFISQKHRGLPSYESFSPFEYKYISDISPDIQVGDRIYFHFNTLVDKNLIKYQFENGKKVYYFKVRYDQVICAVRDGQIIPTSSYTLIEPDMETWEDIQIPTYSNLVGPDGKKKLKPKDQWLVTKAAPESKYLLGYVRHIGNPLKGTTCDLVTGDRIIYRRQANWTNKIEGKDYFAILQKHIIGKFVDGVPVPVATNVFIIPEEQEAVTLGGIHKVKLDIVQRGSVLHPGSSKLQAGDWVEVGEADRQPIKYEGKNFISVDSSSVWGVHRVAKTA
jgi:hypothetical protein